MRSLDDRFLELEALEDGWLDGDGCAIHPHCIELAKKVVPSIQCDHGPHIYPTVIGGVQIEWDYKGQIFSLEIDWIGT